MKVSAKLLKKLNDLGIKYDLVEHRPVYTAYDAAQTMKRKLDQIAKSLLVKAGKNHFLVHVPANKNIDLKKLAKILKVAKVEIPKEQAVVKSLKIKPGTLSSFGFMHKVASVVDKSLLKSKKVVFSTGNLINSLELSVKDFLKTEEIQVGVFAVAKKFKKAKPAKKVKSKKKK